jgi:hypothetical protein
MRIIVACEFSGIVRSAFRQQGHDAWSLDLLACEDGSAYHARCCLTTADLSWAELLVAFPPCTHLAASGARWFKLKQREQSDGLAFVKFIMDAPVDRIAIENPIGIISSRIRKPDQIIQPWQFGHGETKATCLWLKNLPKLKPTRIVDGREPRVHYLSPAPDRWKHRSRTLPGIAEAMAKQWGLK